MPSAVISLLARDIMVKRVISLRPDTEVYKAIQTLIKHQISGAPVVDYDGRYIGIFSEKSSIRVLMNAATDSAPTGSLLNYVDVEAMTITEETHLATIMHIFQESRYRRLPVLNNDGELVGQVSRRDVIKATYRMLPLSDHKAVSESGILYISGLNKRDHAPIG